MPDIKKGIEGEWQLFEYVMVEQSRGFNPISETVADTVRLEEPLLFVHDKDVELEADSFHTDAIALFTVPLLGGLFWLGPYDVAPFEKVRILKGALLEGHVDA